MGSVFEAVGATALLLRGTEGEVVADARRLPQMEGFIAGRRVQLEEGQKGTLAALPALPGAVDPADTAAWIHDVLEGRRPVPCSIALQVDHVVRLAAATEAAVA
jgi:anthranilate phosphoribosyltransferase